MKRIGTKLTVLLLAVCLLAVLTVPALADRDGESTYRVLMMACPGSNLGIYPDCDCDHVESAFIKSLNISGENITHVTPNYSSANKETVLAYFASAFADADDNDINIFYYSGHGSYSDGETSLCTSSKYWLTADDLMAYVEEQDIRGQFILLVDACHSGGMVSKDGSGETEDADAAFAESFARSFQQSAAQEPGTLERGDLTGSNRYKVIAAASQMQVSIQQNDTDISGIFTTAMVTGIGCSPALGDAYHSYPADTDNDGTVTVAELFRWTRQTCTRSLVCCYPENDQTPVVQYDRDNCYGAEVLSASVDPVTVSKSYSVTLTVTYETASPCTLSVEGPLTSSETVSSLRYPVSTMGSSYSLSSDPLGPGTVTDHGTYRGSGTVTLSTRWFSSAVYYLRLLPSTPDGAAILVPFQVASGTSSSEPFSLNLKGLSTDSAFHVTAAIPNELCAEVTFGSTQFGSSPPSSNVSLYCEVLDKNGETVRVLTDWTPATYQRNTELSSIRTAYEAVNRFYWDGKTQSGTYAETGRYTVRVIGRYYVGNDSYTDRVIEKTVEVITPVPTHYTVDFYEGGDQIGTARVADGDKITVPATYSTERSCYRFVGWYTADGSNGNWGRNWDVARDTVSNALRLYARWELANAIGSVETDEVGQIVVSAGIKQNGCLCVAQYDGDEMIRVTTVFVTASNAPQSVTVPVVPLSRCTYRIFLLDGSFTPVTEASVFALPA